ncbi:MAG: amidohydrolase family protein, partial [Clostridia bacterium]
MQIYYNRAYSDGAVLRDGVLYSEHGYFSASANGPELDLRAYNVFPGFIDTHTHGGGGLDSMKADLAKLDTLSAFYASCGVSAFHATTVTATLDAATRAVKTVSERMKKGTCGATLMGAYLEGPYLSAEYRGAHDEALLREIDLDELKALIDAGDGCVKSVAIAPEKPHALDAIRMLRARGVQATLGHSAADQSLAREAIDAGGKIAIHTYNAMAPLKHRDVGLLGMSLIRDDVMNEIICDFIHVCPEAIQVVLRCKGARNVILITDSMDATGMPDGKYLLGELPVTVTNGIARTESGALAGSTLKMNVAVANLVKKLGIAPETA